MEKQGWSVVDLLFLAGAALISFGVGILSLPGGLITAGGFCILGSVLADLSARAEKRGEGEK